MPNQKPLQYYLIPELLPGYSFIKAKYAGSRKPFTQPPRAIVLHSGDKNPGVAEWFAKKHNFRKCWTHFAWSETHECFVQCESLLETTTHAGNPWNDISIGIELPGPWFKNPRDVLERIYLRWLIKDLYRAVPYLEMITAHQFLNPSKKDPGVGLGVDEMWVDDLDLAVCFIKQYR